MFKAKLYFITCESASIGFEEQAEQSCEGGADAVLFRSRKLSSKEILATGHRIKDICLKHKTLFILNDRPDLALALDSDGVHLGQDDIPTIWARQVLGGRKIIGRTVTSLGQATNAVKESVDYIIVSPLYSNPSGMVSAENSIDLIRMIKERIKVPVIATGGITKDNIQEVLSARADGIAISKSVCGAASTKEAIASLKNKISVLNFQGMK